jgi:hypothetical protein
MDQFKLFVESANRLGAMRRLEYIHDTSAAVGGLFSKSSSKLKDRLAELAKLAGIENGK